MADTNRTVRLRAGALLATRIPFYYGWVMLLVAMMAQIATFPGQTVGVSVFNVSFRESLQLNHGQLTGAYMLGSFLASLPMLLIGAMMDRFGIRWVMTVVVIFLGGVCILTSQVNGLVTLFGAFFLLRLLGQGALSLLASNTLAMWFHDRLGTATGIMAFGWAGVTSIGPFLTLLAIKAFEWRSTWCVLGLLVWALMLPLLAFVFRNRPEEIGQHVDGVTKRPDEHVASIEGMTLRSALRTRAFWIVCAMSAMTGMIGTGILFNVIPLFQAAGRTDFQAIGAIALFGICLAVAQLIGGILADRFALHRLLVLGLTGYVIGLGCLVWLHLPGMAHAFAVAIGSAEGLLQVTSATLWARYFGRAHLGKIRGSVWMGIVAGSSMGPFVMGITYDHFGRYDSILWLFMAVAFVLIVAMKFATTPRDRIE